MFCVLNSIAYIYIISIIDRFFVLFDINHITKSDYTALIAVKYYNT